MKKLTVIALSLLTAGAAMADGGNSSDYGREAALAARQTQTATVQANSRTAVVAELQRARQAGELQGLDREVDQPVIATGATRSRAEVVAELTRARANGELEILNGDRADYAHLANLKNQTVVFSGQLAAVQ